MHHHRTVQRGVSCAGNAVVIFTIDKPRRLAEHHANNATAPTNPAIGIDGKDFYSVSPFELLHTSPNLQTLNIKINDRPPKILCIRGGHREKVAIALALPIREFVQALELDGSVAIE